MPRPIQVRPSYKADTVFLRRLQAAIEIDERRSTDWRRRTVQALESVMILLREADLEDDKARLAAEAEESTVKPPKRALQRR